MSEDKINFKVYLGISILLLGTVFFLLIKNIIDYRNLIVKKEKLENIQKQLEKIISTEEFSNISNLDQKYQKYLSENITTDGITSYTNLTSNLASENNISIYDTKVIDSNSEYFEIQNTIKWSPQSVATFIEKIGGGSILREITKSEIRFYKNQIEMELTVRNYKIK